MRTGHLPAFLAILLLSACASTDGPASPNDPPGGGGPPPAGGRILAMDVKEAADGDYLAALQAALDVGVQEIKQSWDWDLTEDGFGTAADYPAIADLVFGSVDADVVLVLRPVDTVRNTYPAGVPSDPLDHPAALSAFAAFLDSIHARLPSLRTQGKVRSILVGNEIDGYLGTDEARWAQFGRFLAAARDHIESLDWGPTPPQVGSIVMFAGVTDSVVARLYRTYVLPHCDRAAVNYYPLDAAFQMRDPSEVPGDLQAIAQAFPDHLVELVECGCSSGAACGSSPTQQAAFVSAVFSAWDDLAARIVKIDFAWETDVSDATASQWVQDYGMEGQPGAVAFEAYLRTLGLREHDGTPKPAWNTLVAEAAARGWVASAR